MSHNYFQFFLLVLFLGMITHINSNQTIPGLESKQDDTPKEGETQEAPIITNPSESKQKDNQTEEEAKSPPKDNNEVTKEEKPKLNDTPIDNTSTSDTNNTLTNSSKDYAAFDPNLSKIIASSNEDEIAKNWIYIFTVCIFLSLIVFIYNVIKCYHKIQIVQRPNDTRTYSKELQNISATDDDPVIDLSN